ncbi:hypothetical protein Aduo_000528 [Ancylostoma duodenale]
MNSAERRGAEMVEHVPDADAIFLAIGGGGMASGVAAYVSEVRPDVKVFLVEPEGKGLSDYLNKGGLTTEKDVVDTIADGIRVLRVGENCYPILKRTSADKIITVTDKEIREALKLLWTRAKKVVLILCGGNVDLDFVP